MSAGVASPKLMYFHSVECRNWMLNEKMSYSFHKANLNEAYINAERYLRFEFAKLLSRYAHLFIDFVNLNNHKQYEGIEFYFHKNKQITVDYQYSTKIIDRFDEKLESCPRKYIQMIVIHLVSYEFNIVKKHINISALIWIILDYCHL